MPNQFTDLLYKDSPFLPKITPQNLENIRLGIAFDRRPLIVAISFELLEICIQTNKEQEENLDWIVDTFPLDDYAID